MQKLYIERFAKLDYECNEAMNALCTNLFFTGGDIRKIMVTSCRPQEGKTFISMNLMRSMARLGKKVVLVDADIRTSALQTDYGIRAEPAGAKRFGLTHYLAGQCAPEEVLAQTNLPDAWMILSGRTVTNSLPLLNRPRLRTLLDQLSEQFDIVLVDVPPVGTIIDAARIAASCDGTLFVVQSGAVSGRELQEAMLQIERSGSPILGVVLNQCDEKKLGRHDARMRYYGEGKTSQAVKRRGRAH